MVFIHHEDREFTDIIKFACAEGDVVEAAAEIGVAVFEETVLAIAKAAVDFDIGLGQGFAGVFVGDADVAVVLDDLDGEVIGVVGS